jgi:hypothetical protein
MTVSASRLAAGTTKQKKTSMIEISKTQTLAGRADYLADAARHTSKVINISVSASQTLRSTEQASRPKGSINETSNNCGCQLLHANNNRC